MATSLAIAFAAFAAAVSGAIIAYSADGLTKTYAAAIGGLVAAIAVATTVETRYSEAYAVAYSVGVAAIAIAASTGGWLASSAAIRRIRFALARRYLYRRGSELGAVACRYAIRRSLSADNSLLGEHSYSLTRLADASVGGADALGAKPEPSLYRAAMDAADYLGEPKVAAAIASLYRAAYRLGYASDAKRLAGSLTVRRRYAAAKVSDG